MKYIVLMLICLYSSSAFAVGICPESGEGMSYSSDTASLNPLDDDKVDQDLYRRLIHMDGEEFSKRAEDAKGDPSRFVYNHYGIGPGHSPNLVHMMTDCAAKTFEAATEARKSRNNSDTWYY